MSDTKLDLASLNRAIAVRIIREGGEVYLVGSSDHAKSESDLPAADFEIRSISVPYPWQSVQGRPPLSVDDLRQMCSIPTLDGLYLSGDDITREHLMVVGKAHSLKSLGVNSAQVTEMAPVAAQTELTFLSLSSCPVDSAGLKTIPALHKLRELILAGTRVDDDLFSTLEGLPKLEYLSLLETGITDVGMRTLKRLSSLKTVCLRKTLVTDRGLAELAELSSLKLVDVRNTQVTPEGIKKFLGRLGYEIELWSSYAQSD